MLKTTEADPPPFTEGLSSDYLSAVAWAEDGEFSIQNEKCPFERTDDTPDPLPDWRGDDTKLADCEKAELADWKEFGVADSDKPESLKADDEELPQHDLEQTFALEYLSPGASSMGSTTFSPDKSSEGNWHDHVLYEQQKNVFHFPLPPGVQVSDAQFLSAVAADLTKKQPIASIGTRERLSNQAMSVIDTVNSTRSSIRDVWLQSQKSLIDRVIDRQPRTSDMKTDSSYNAPSTELGRISSADLALLEEIEAREEDAAKLARLHASLQLLEVSGLDPLSPAMYHSSYAAAALYLNACTQGVSSQPSLVTHGLGSDYDGERAEIGSSWSRRDSRTHSEQNQGHGHANCQDTGPDGAQPPDDTSEAACWPQTWRPTSTVASPSGMSDESSSESAISGSSSPILSGEFLAACSSESGSGASSSDTDASSIVSRSSWPQVTPECLRDESPRAAELFEFRYLLQDNLFERSEGSKQEDASLPKVDNRPSLYSAQLSAVNTPDVDGLSTPATMDNLPSPAAPTPASIWPSSSAVKALQSSSTTLGLPEPTHARDSDHLAHGLSTAISHDKLSPTISVLDRPRPLGRRRPSSFFGTASFDIERQKSAVAAADPSTIAAPSSRLSVQTPERLAVGLKPSSSFDTCSTSSSLLLKPDIPIRHSSLESPASSDGSDDDRLQAKPANSPDAFWHETRQLLKLDQSSPMRVTLSDLERGRNRQSTPSVAGDHRPSPSVRSALVRPMACSQVMSASSSRQSAVRFEPSSTSLSSASVHSQRPLPTLLRGKALQEVRETCKRDAAFIRAAAAARERGNISVALPPQQWRPRTFEDMSPSCARTPGPRIPHPAQSADCSVKAISPPAGGVLITEEVLVTF